MSLRFVKKDGKKILQQRNWRTLNWEDVPEIEEDDFEENIVKKIDSFKCENYHKPQFLFLSKDLALKLYAKLEPYNSYKGFVKFVYRGLEVIECLNVDKNFIIVL